MRSDPLTGRPRVCPGPGRSKEAAKGPRPEATYLKPQGVPLKDLSEVCLAFHCREALRLVDLEGSREEEASKRLNLSPEAFARVLAGARLAVTQAVVHGWALRIEADPHLVEGRGREVDPAEEIVSEL